MSQHPNGIEATIRVAYSCSREETFASPENQSHGNHHYCEKCAHHQGIESGYQPEDSACGQTGDPPWMIEVGLHSATLAFQVNCGDDSSYQD